MIVAFTLQLSHISVSDCLSHTFIHHVHQIVILLYKSLLHSSLNSSGPKALASEIGLINECPQLVTVLTTCWPQLVTVLTTC